jgi:diguanylate cyclase (GGDEF)-like protein/PAS domain S-box-containing protein/putative nucleotidyltransferase with HDIG domain
MTVNTNRSRPDLNTAPQPLAALEQSADGIVLADLTGTITFANKAWAALHGHEPADLIGRTLGEVHTKGQIDSVLEPLYTRSEREGSSSAEVEHVRKDGSTFRSSMVVTLLRSEKGDPSGYMSVVREIAEKQREERPHFDGTANDPLTGALNHGALIEEMHALPEDRPGSHSIVLLDVDGLNVTNDTYGHAVGDAVLQEVATILGEDELETIVGRYGGDEFVVLLPGVDHDEAEAYRDRVLAKFDSTAVKGENDNIRVPVCVSMGVATYPDDADDIGVVLNLADSATYSSRQQKPLAPAVAGGRRLLGKERAAQLVAEIVPLLTRSGTREEKLALVAQHLSAGASYDAVNFEVAGDTPEPPEWQSTHIRAPKGIVDAWQEEQNQSENHPLGRILEETRGPVFLDNVETDERLTAKERELLGAIGIKSGLVVPMIWQDAVVGMLSVGSSTETGFHSWDAQFLTAVASQVTAIVFMTTLVEELQEATNNIKEAHGETVLMLASVAEANDNTTGRHLQRVRAVSEALAKELGYSVEDAEEFGLAAVLHDIGKIQVPGELLRKADSLTDKEWAIMRQHTTWGADFLRGRRGFALAEGRATPQRLRATTFRTLRRLRPSQIASTR